MATITWGTLTDRIARRAHKNLDIDEDRDDVEYYAKAGIELVESEEAWRWLRTAYTISLVAGTYQYNWPAGMARFDVRTFRYGGLNTYLGWGRRPENIDTELSPTWRTDTSLNGTPRLFVDHGQTFWFGPTPDAAFVASNPTMYFYGWATDLYTISQLAGVDQATDDAVSLKIPTDRAELYICAALKEGLQQEDDPDWVRFEQKFQNALGKARAFNVDVNTDEQLQQPEWAWNMRY